jgi:hypothetical protein
VIGDYYHMTAFWGLGPDQWYERYYDLTPEYDAFGPEEAEMTCPPKT